MNKFISVVIPVYNRKELLRRCLLCFQKQTYSNFNIIVVDDGSTDGTYEMLKRDFNDVITLRGDGTLWWTGSINKGIKYALSNKKMPDYILVINDDLEIYNNYLESLLDVAKKNPKSLIGSVIVDYNNPNVINNGGEIIHSYTAKHKILNKGKYLSDFRSDKIIKVFRLTGRGVLIPSNIFNEIGLYDSKHFKQCGDTEFTIRAKKAGYSLLVSYRSVILSHLNSSDEQNIKNSYRIRDIYKHFFGIKSNANLKYFFHYTKTLSNNPFHFLSYFIFGLSRKFFHFFIRAMHF